jgi:hypothetical protein
MNATNLEMEFLADGPGALARFYQANFTTGFTTSLLVLLLHYWVFSRRPGALARFYQANRYFTTGFTTSLLGLLLLIEALLSGKSLLYYWFYYFSTGFTTADSSASISPLVLRWIRLADLSLYADVC